jgi:hypothetical protein avisC_05682
MPADVYGRALYKALNGMTDGPETLHPIVSAFLVRSGQTISPEEIPELVLDADTNAPERTQLHIRISQWDAEKDVSWAEGTAPGTSERRNLVLELLGLSGAAESINTAWPPVLDRTAMIVNPTWAPWYDEDRRRGHHFYWDDYRKILERRLSPEAVASIDSVTTDIVSRLADPSSRTPYQSKGLVVGHVQSGKTANFTGVIAKAIDAGYRLVIVLTGTVELLRAQTQRRLDMELIGTENILGGIDPGDRDLLADVDYAGTDDVDWKEGRFVSHGDLAAAGVPTIRRLTCAKVDYKRLKAGLDTLDPRSGNELKYPEKPVWHPDNIHSTDARIVVVKKNKYVLTELVDDLRRIRAPLSEIPALIIDDEADQASVNTINPRRATADRERTAINKLIAELLGRLDRAQYVGYTATPFANVFVSPEDAEDIFPRDFILSLSAPSGYQGGRAYHDFEELTDQERNDPAVSNERAFVRDLRAPDDDPDAVDDELRGALDSFVLTGAVKLWRASVAPGLSGAFRHHTMLVHESVAQKEHADLANRIRRLWGEAEFGSPRASARLRKLFDKDLKVVTAARQWESGLPKAATFDEVSPFIGEVLDRVLVSGGDPVVVVNGDKDHQYNQVDFQRDRVWRIMVGGAKLSRGFTLEGLTITYFKRKAMQADSLMQMGRWFGYRRGYPDLVRLFMAREVKGRGRQVYDLYEAFGAIMRDEEDFRAQLEVFSQVEEDGVPAVRPIDIPPLVFQQLPWLRPTSRNKMYNAELDYSGIGGQLQDFPRQPERGNGSVNTEHFGLVRPWLETGRFGPVEDFEYWDDRTGRTGSFKGRVAIVTADEMRRVLQGFHWVEKFDFGPTLRMIGQAEAERKLEDWAVLLPELSGSTVKTVDGIDVPMLKRTRRDGTRGGFSGSSFRQRDAIESIAGRPGARGGDSARAYCTGRRGAMLLTFAADTRPGQERSPRLLPGSMPAADTATIFSLALPYGAAPKGRIVFSVRRPDKRDEPVVDVVSIPEPERRKS